MSKGSFSYWQLLILAAVLFVAVPGPFTAVDGRRGSLLYGVAYHAEDMIAAMQRWTDQVESSATRALVPAARTMGCAFVDTVSELLDTALIGLATARLVTQY